MSHWGKIETLVNQELDYLLKAPSPLAAEDVKTLEVISRVCKAIPVSGDGKSEPTDETRHISDLSTDELTKLL